jgi:hypothetical protein
VPLSLGALALTVVVLASSAVRVFNRGEDDSGLGSPRFRWGR